MKISDFLAENPHINLTDLDHSMFGKVQQNSLENLNRVCHYLGAKEISNRQYHFWLNKAHGFAKVTTASKDNPDEYQDVCSKIEFNKRAVVPDFDQSKQLQVSLVYTATPYQTERLAFWLYAILTVRGYVIISDFEQYKGGKQIWVNIIKAFQNDLIKVRVWDDSEDDWIRDTETNEPLLFNNHNIESSKIWTMNYSEPTTLLVMSTK